VSACADDPDRIEVHRGDQCSLLSSAGSRSSTASDRDGGDAAGPARETLRTCALASSTRRRLDTMSEQFPGWTISRKGRPPNDMTAATPPCTTAAGAGRICPWNRAARDRYGAGRIGLYLGTSTRDCIDRARYRRRDPKTGALPRLPLRRRRKTPIRSARSCGIISGWPDRDSWCPPRVLLGQSPRQRRAHDRRRICDAAVVRGCRQPVPHDALWISFARIDCAGAVPAL